MIRYVPVVLLVAAVSGCMPSGSAESETFAADSLHILEMLDTMQIRAAAADIGFFDVYDDRAIVMLPNRWDDADRTAAESFYAGVLERVPQIFRGNSREVHELVISGDWAFLRVTFRRPPTVVEDRNVRGGSRHMMIWRRQPSGGWKLHRDIFNNPPSR